ncbi:hypothetical protein MHO82_13520 [Vibrio sp. Of7-15]|uniref:hypothetical protein n=1 Tax=Vibrio sp. Of7-15 TaxID=2724879 RepID=UPI001EF3C7C2|nr:hypothetical protein [Vibrio sp. Of7-15]MCG7497884.1 hypothetical protein [Vibrio sp. Of7-15]
MSIFTVFFCGTGSHSEDHSHSNYINGELISTLAKNAIGQDLLDFALVDGVGSGNRSEWMKHSKDDVYGSLLGTLGGRGIDSNMNHIMSVLRGDRMDKGDYQSRAEDMLSASRPQEKARFWHFSKTDAFLKWQDEAKALAKDLRHALMLQRANIAAERVTNPITQVNMVGWSRGGVSCFELANRMRKDPKLKHIPVNIFACDPVPGGMNAFTDYKTLGANVKQIVCVFAEDERSLAFKARMPRLNKATKYYTTFMPGRHGTLVGNAHTSGGKKGNELLTGPGIITRDFMEKVLTGWGSRLKQSTMLNLSKESILERYQQIQTNHEYYEAQHGITYTMKNRILWSSKDRIGQKRESWMGIPTYRFNFPGINNDYGTAINRHHSDVLGNNIFATKGISGALVNFV